MDQIKTLRTKLLSLSLVPLTNVDVVHSLSLKRRLYINLKILPGPGIYQYQSLIFKCLGLDIPLDGHRDVPGCACIVPRRAVMSCHHHASCWEYGPRHSPKARRATRLSSCLMLHQASRWASSRPADLHFLF